ncbi:MAG: putative toxin-antitoxin system toxin component, PIN family [Acidobacteriota bacterium]|nr:putative toxin-antitoxin system toxin component, PIN family [Acidobacteriota bacterium]MDH3523085.1 putative toxin-antitoxin system toxin component, PIN family [Acidobacteriota bacterium]
MKIVLDTNVLVSGLLRPAGPSGLIVRLVAAGDLVLCHDARILGEYAEVLRRERFCFDPDRVDTLMAQIRAEGVPVAARPLTTRLPDADDEPFLEIAIAARARCLVTGNLRHYPPAARLGVEVLAPRAFVELYRSS